MLRLAILTAFVLSFCPSISRSADLTQKGAPAQLDLGTITVAQAKGKAKKKTTSFDAEAPLSNGAWIRVHSGFDLLFMGDINGSLQAWEDLHVDAGYIGSTSPVPGGLSNGLELGFTLDKSNALSLDTTFVVGFPGRFEGMNPGGAVTFTIAPYMVGGTLNYHLTLIEAPGVRTNLRVGGGYFHAFADATFTFMGSTGTGTFSGDVFAGIFGIDQDFDLGGGIALNLGVRGRFAPSGRMGSDNVTMSGGPPPPTETEYLAIGEFSPGYDVLFMEDAAAIDSDPDVDYAVVDMSAIQAEISLKISL